MDQFKLCISKGRLVEFVQEKIIRPNLAEKCKNLVVVTDGSAIITGTNLQMCRGQYEKYI